GSWGYRSTALCAKIPGVDPYSRAPMTGPRQRTRPMRSLDVACGAAVLSSFLLAGCASNGEAPGAAWRAWATLRSLAGSPPKPPDLYEEPVRVTDALEFAEITAGGEHTCALTVDGETYCWGSNRDDQLCNASITETCGEGAGAYPCSSSPVRVPDMPRFKSIVAMRSGTCGLDESGAVHCWGGGFGGRDEAGFRTSSAAPIRVPRSEERRVGKAGGVGGARGPWGLALVHWVR